DGDLPHVEAGSEGADPVPEACPEGARVDAVEDALEGVVRRRAVGQREEAAEPVQARAGEEVDLLPVVAVRDDGADGDDDDVEEPMPAAAPPPRVLEPGEVTVDGQPGHDSPPCNRDVFGESYAPSLDRDYAPPTIGARFNASALPTLARPIRHSMCNILPVRV